MGRYSKPVSQEEDPYAWPTEETTPAREPERKTIVRPGSVRNPFAGLSAEADVFHVPIAPKRTTMSKIERQRYRYAAESDSEGSDGGVVIGNAAGYSSDSSSSSGTQFSSAPKQTQVKNKGRPPPTKAQIERWKANGRNKTKARKFAMLATTPIADVKIVSTLGPTPTWELKRDLSSRSSTTTTTFNPTTSTKPFGVAKKDTSARPYDSKTGTVGEMWNMQKKESNSTSSSVSSLKGDTDATMEVAVVPQISGATFEDGQFVEEEEITFEGEMLLFFEERTEKMLDINKYAGIIDKETTVQQVCRVCAGKTDIWAVGKCLHSICSLCCLRLRVFFKATNCVVCDTEWDKVRFTSNPLFLNGMRSDEFLKMPKHDIYSVNYEQLYDDQLNEEPFQWVTLAEFTTDGTRKHDERQGIYFDKLVEYQTTMRLLQFNCPVCKKAVNCSKKSEFMEHVSKEHKLCLCPLCFKKSPVFTHELFVYTKSQLEQHLSRHDGCPEVDVEFTGHPVCNFCKKRYFDQDNLIEHCKATHVACEVCEKWGIFNQFFADVKERAEHWIKVHFVCSHPDCKGKESTTVYGTETDLYSHEESVHGKVTRISSGQKPARMLPPARQSGGFKSRQIRQQMETLPTFVRLLNDGTQAWPVRPGSSVDIVGDDVVPAEDSPYRRR